MTEGAGSILVLGAGAIGGYLGARLAAAGRSVSLVTRVATAERINADGLTVTERGQTSTVRLAAYADVEQALGAAGEPELVVLSMKGYDLAEAVGSLHSLPPSTLFLTTQNGIGIEEIVAKAFGPERVLSSAVTIPIRKETSTHLIVEKHGRGIGMAAVRPDNPALASWAAALAGAGLKVSTLHDYRAMKWSKAFLNIMGNATSAVLGMPPAAIIRDDAGFQLEMDMLHEMLAVMDRAGLRIVNLPGAGVTPLAFAVGHLPRAVMRGVMEQVARRGRGDKMPSFYLDLHSGVGRSEVVFHNGAIAAEGSRVGLPTPVNALLNDVLLDLIAGRRDPTEFEGRPDRLLAELRGIQSPTS